MIFTIEDTSLFVHFWEQFDLFAIEKHLIALFKYLYWNSSQAKSQ